MAIIATVSFIGLKEAIALPVPLTFILTYVLLQHACYCDEKNNANLLLNCLPISRKKIVLSRYLSLFIFFLISLAFGIILSSISELIFYNTVHFRYSAETIISVMIATLLVNSIGLPVFYIFGYTKARIINIFLFIGVFNTFLAWKAAGKLMQILFNSYFGVVIALLIYVLSYIVASVMYSRREF